jgi:hypothetical protein
LISGIYGLKKPRGRSQKINFNKFFLSDCSFLKREEEPAEEKLEEKNQDKEKQK